VTFSYPGQKFPALADVSFAVEPGERVGLIGRIGSGKTTIEKLVLGLYEPERGAVLLDGTDLARSIPPTCAATPDRREDGHGLLLKPILKARARALRER
jgi:ABC-type bacteriocin/lantibiotic exporter with double-glycine peptidase domain